MFLPGQIVLWWRAFPWGPACGIVAREDGDVLEVVEDASHTVRLHLPSFSAEHAPRVVGKVELSGQPTWSVT